MNSRGLGYLVLGLFATALFLSFGNAGSSRETEKKLKQGGAGTGSGDETHSQSDLSLGHSSQRKRPQGTPAGAASTISELRRLEGCYWNESCGVDEVWPDSHHAAVSAAIAMQLRSLADAESAGGEPNAAVLETARRYMQFPDDQVKWSALELIALASPSSDNFAAIVVGLRDTTDARLLREGLTVLETYRGGQEQAKLDVFILESIRTGPHTVADEVARRSLMFMTVANAGRFAALEAQLPLRSRARQFLQLNLREFRRMQQGG